MYFLYFLLSRTQFYASEKSIKFKHFTELREKHEHANQRKWISRCQMTKWRLNLMLNAIRLQLITKNQPGYSTRIPKLIYFAF